MNPGTIVVLRRLDSGEALKTTIDGDTAIDHLFTPSAFEPSGTAVSSMAPRRPTRAERAIRDAHPGDEGATLGANIAITTAELESVRSLGAFDMTMLLSDIHEYGWATARKTLACMLDRSEFDDSSPAQAVIDFAVANGWIQRVRRRERPEAQA